MLGVREQIARATTQPVAATTEGSSAESKPNLATIEGPEASPQQQQQQQQLLQRSAPPSTELSARDPHV